MTQTELASKINLTKTSFIDIEKGRKNMHLERVLLIAMALEVHFSELIPKSFTYNTGFKLYFDDYSLQRYDKEFLFGIEKSLIEAQGYGNPDIAGKL